MNTNTPASKSQKRAAALLGIEIKDSYFYAAEELEAKGFYRDGIPTGQDWRTASKLGDSELVSKLTMPEPEDDSNDLYYS